MALTGMNTILIVDDDQSTCETLSDIFSLHNYLILTAQTGSAAIEMIANNSVDVVLLDIRLPDVDGLELMKKLRDQNSDLIFIFMTGYASVEYTKKAYEQGAGGFFVKPVLIEEAIHVIKEAVEKRNLAKEYRRAEKERNKALTEFEDLYNNSPDMYASVDIDLGVVTQCNDTLLDVLGFQRDEVIGVKVIELYHPDCRKRVEQEIWGKLLDIEVISNQELKLIRKNGEQLYVILNGSIAKDSGGTVSQVRMAWHDITERKKLEEQLLVSEKMTIIAGLAAGVAHEINTPLSGILQSIQLVEMGLDPATPANREIAEKHEINLDKVAEYIRDKELDFFFKGIRESAVTAARIVADLLQFSRPHESQWTVSNLIKVIERAVALAKSDYSLKKENNINNVTFVYEFPSFLPEVKCMAMEIEQVIINLIKNSCQAMIEGTVSLKNPKIIIKSYQVEDNVVIEVVDNGPGVSKEISHQVFDPFFTTKEVGVGTGLGLSVSYSIICVKHGGDIEVESIPNEVTSFKISLPINKE